MQSLIPYVITAILSIFGSLLFCFLSVGRYKQKVDDLVEDKKESSKKIECLRTDTDTLKEFRVNAQKFIDKTLYESKSPLELSPHGKKIVDESGFRKIFDGIKDDLVKQLEQKEPATKYDVQEKARALMDELGDYPAFKSIKTYAFNNGLDFLQILRAGSILLRDYYFSVHPEIEN